MCAPLISRDGQQQSRGVNSCIRVLIIAVMRSLLGGKAHAHPISPFTQIGRSGRDKKKGERARAFFSLFSIWAA